MPIEQLDRDARELLIRETADRTAYTFEAFVFVLETLPLLFSPSRPQDHIDAAELCWRLRDRSIIKFGPQARERLESWSIRTCEDVGNIIYAMIESGLMAKTEQDSQTDFQGVFDFDSAFGADAKPRYPNDRYQWRLSTMFVLTTIAAIALAGFAQLGIQGAVGTVFSSWIGLIGAFFLVQGLRDRSRGWLISVCFGVGILALAIAIFLAITLQTRQ